MFLRSLSARLLVLTNLAAFFLLLILVLSHNSKSEFPTEIADRWPCYLDSYAKTDYSPQRRRT